MKIMLIHGQGRSPWAMRLLGWRLRQYQVHYFGYRCFKQSLADITARFVATLRQTMGESPYIIVSHSLGGLITRASLPYLEDMLPRHVIMLAPPNQPAKLAKIAFANPIYRFFTGDCGRQLASDAFYEALPIPTVPTTIVAGTKGLYGRFSPFGEALNDMAVAVEEAKLSAESDVILLPARHALIMNSRRVAEIVLGVVGATSSNV